MFKHFKHIHQQKICCTTATLSLPFPSSPAATRRLIEAALASVLWPRRPKWVCPPYLPKGRKMLKPSWTLKMSLRFFVRCTQFPTETYVETKVHVPNLCAATFSLGWYSALREEAGKTFLGEWHIHLQLHQPAKALMEKSNMFKIGGSNLGSNSYDISWIQRCWHNFADWRCNHDPCLGKSWKLKRNLANSWKIAYISIAKFHFETPSVAKNHLKPRKALEP